MAAQNQGSLEIVLAANTAALVAAERRIKSLVTSLRKAQRTAEQMAGGTDKTNKAVKELGRETRKANKKVSDFNVLLRDTASASVFAVGPLSGFGARVQALGAIINRSNIAIAAMIAGVVGLVVGIAKLSAVSVRASIEIEKIQAGLRAVTDTSSEAKAEFNFVAREADRLALDLASAGKEYAKLSAATRGTSLEGKATRDVFTALAQAAAVVQLSTDEAEGAFRAVRQIISKTKVQAEELTGQLGERLPGALEAVAKELGITTQELLKLGAEGKLLAQEFIPALTTALQRMSETGVEEATKTLAAELRRLSTQWLVFRDSVSAAFGISSSFKDFIITLTDTLRSLRKEMNSIAKVSGLVAGGLFALASPVILAGFLRLLNIIKKLTVSTFAFNTVLTATGGLGGLIIRLGVAIGGAVVGYRLLGRATNEVATEQQALLERVEATIRAYQDLGQTQFKQRRGNIKDLREQITAEEDLLLIIAEQAMGLRGAQPISAFRQTVRGPIFDPGIRNKIEEINKQIRDLGIQSGAAKERLETLREALSLLLETTFKEPPTPGPVLKSLRDMTQAAEALADAYRGSAKDVKRFKNELRIEKILEVQIAKLQEVGFSATEAAEKVIPLAFAHLKASAAAEEHTERITRLKKEEQELAAVLKRTLTPLEIYTQKLGILDREFRKGKLSAEEAAVAQMRIGEEYQSSTNSLEQYLKKLRNESIAIGQSSLELEIAKNVQTAMNKAKKDGTAFLGEHEAAIRADTTAIRDAKKAIQDTQQAQRLFANTLASGFARGILEGENLVDVIGNIGRALAEASLRALIFRSIMSGFGGGGQTNPILTGTDVGIVPNTAHGGVITGGQARLVGEHGPELFTPHSSGQITPNGQLGGMTVMIDARGADLGVEERLRSVIREMGELTFRRTIRTVAAQSARTVGLSARERT